MGRQFTLLRSRSMGVGGFLALSALLVVLPSAVCNAAAITFDDLTESMTISWIGFDAVGINGAAPIVGTGPHSVTVAEGTPATPIGFGGLWTPIPGQPAPPLVATSGSVALLEDAVSGFVSDTLFFNFFHGPTTDGSVVVGPNQLRISGIFTSDDELHLFAAPTVPRLVETGDYQFVQNLLGAPDSLTIRVRSDAVPEPASLLLLGSGLILAAGARRWKGRTVA